MQPTNPYTPGGMIKTPAMFFGRAQALHRIRDRLRKGDSTAVVGLRRIGKSSLLYQLAHRTAALPPHALAKTGLATDNLKTELARLAQYKLVEEVAGRYKIQVPLTRRAFVRFAQPDV